MAFITFLLFVILCSCLCYHEVQGKVFISKEEDLEMEKQLEILNKHSVKTVQDYGGDLFDCIEMEKQPAFNHPLLKNHKIQTRSSFFHKSSGSKASTQSRPSILALKNLQCPQGTVPVRRTRKEDLMRSKAFFQQYYPNLIHQPNGQKVPGQFVAVIETRNYSGLTYFGIQGSINLQNPKVEGEQYSSARLWVDSGDQGDPNTIQTGWMVAPKIYGDSKTHLFTAWNNKNSSCYDLLCSGFVQVDRNIAPGQVFNRTSIYNGQQYDIRLSIHQANDTNWWLTILTTTLHVDVGYWPSSLFSKLQMGAATVVWGGVVGGPVNGVIPPMGNGLFPDDDGDFREACYISNIIVSNQTMDFPPDYAFAREQVDNRNCNDVKNFPILSSPERYATQFGGPGGACGV